MTTESLATNYFPLKRKIFLGNPWNKRIRDCARCFSSRDFLWFSNFSLDRSKLSSIRSIGDPTRLIPAILTLSWNNIGTRFDLNLFNERRKDRTKKLKRRRYNTVKNRLPRVKPKLKVYTWDDLLTMMKLSIAIIYQKKIHEKVKKS